MGWVLWGLALQPSVGWGILWGRALQPSAGWGISAEHAARHALLTIALAGFALAFFFTPQFWASIAFSALIGWLSLFKR